MARKLKRSERIIAVIALLMISSVVAYAWFIKKNVQEIELECSLGLLLGEGKIVLDSLKGPYTHLHSEFAEVQLDPFTENAVYISAFENVREYYHVEIIGDVLHVKKRADCDPKTVTKESKNAVKIIVGARSLKQITASNGGSVVHPLKPYGSDKTGKPAYDKNLLAKHLFRFDSIQINVGIGGHVDLLLDGSNMNLNFRLLPIGSTRRIVSASGFPGMVLYGEVEELVIDEIEGPINLSAKYLNAKHVRINPNKNTGRKNSGSATVNVSESLLANLYSDMDVFYYGHPRIIKEETGFGRVVNNNYEH